MRLNVARVPLTGLVSQICVKSSHIGATLSSGGGSAGGAAGGLAAGEAAAVGAAMEECRVACVRLR